MPLPRSWFPTYKDFFLIIQLAAKFAFIESPTPFRLQNPGFALALFLPVPLRIIKSGCEKPSLITKGYSHIFLSTLTLQFSSFSHFETLQFADLSQSRFRIIWFSLVIFINSLFLASRFKLRLYPIAVAGIFDTLAMCSPELIMND